MAITFEAYAKNNLCYKAARTMPTGSPAGIIIHSTGANNPNLKRYVNAPEICGENPYRNYFDRPDSNVCPHAVIGKDKNGEVKAAKLLLERLLLGLRLWLKRQLQLRPGIHTD